MTMTSRYNGKCRTCGLSISKGDQINWTKQTGASHVDCDTPASDFSPKRRRYKRYDNIGHRMSAHDRYGVAGAKTGTGATNGHSKSQRYGTSSRRRRGYASSLGVTVTAIIPKSKEAMMSMGVSFESMNAFAILPDMPMPVISVHLFCCAAWCADVFNYPAVYGLLNMTGDYPVAFPQA